MARIKYQNTGPLTKYMERSQSPTPTISTLDLLLGPGMQSYLDLKDLPALPRDTWWRHGNRIMTQGETLGRET